MADDSSQVFETEQPEHDIGLIKNQHYIQINESGNGRRTRTRGIFRRKIEGFDLEDPYIMLTGNLEIGRKLASIYIPQDGLNILPCLGEILAEIAKPHKDRERIGSGAESVVYRVPGRGLVVKECEKEFPINIPDGSRNDMKLNPVRAFYHYIGNKLALEKRFPDGKVRLSVRYVLIDAGENFYIVEELVKGVQTVGKSSDPKNERLVQLASEAMPYNYNRNPYANDEIIMSDGSIVLLDTTSLVEDRTSHWYRMISGYDESERKR